MTLNWSKTSQMAIIVGFLDLQLRPRQRILQKFSMRVPLVDPTKVHPKMSQTERFLA